MPNVNARILLWGIEGCGKTTTLRTIHSKLQPDLRGELRQEPTRLDPSVHYETLPISLGQVGDVATHLELIAVPGADDQMMTRKQLLDEVDGLILVLDCSAERIGENRARINELRSSLEAYGRSLDSFPIVLQYNKRDIADPFAIEDLHRRIGLEQAAVFETIATTGHGVLATLTTIAKNVVRSLRGDSQEIEPAAAITPAVPQEITQPTVEIAEPVQDETAFLEVESAEDLVPAAHELLEAAILAEGEAEDLEVMANAAEPDLRSDGTPDWGAEEDEASKPEMNLAGDLRIVSVGQAALEADGGIRLPLVLGDESGQSRSVVLALRLEALEALEGDGRD
ncbi:MAG: hypothetical protein CL933_15155 [Deltaproteobacteria bacterium]|nr:hypothetical protein [Deltaproteobacteria bacterium]